MVQLVGDDGVLGPQQGLEEAAVGVEAGGIEDGVLHAHELGDARLQLLVDVLGAADEADGGEAEAPLHNPLLKAPNCYLTGHSAWATVEARQKIVYVTADSIRGVLEGKPDGGRSGILNPLSTGRGT